MGFWDAVGKAASVAATVGMKALEDGIARAREEQAKTAEYPGNSASYQHGKPDCNVAFVGSAPGQFEEKAKAPFSGEAGRYLDHAIRALHEKDAERFNAANKSEARLSNASEQVHFRARTRRTEAKSSDNLKVENVLRVASVNSSSKIRTVGALGVKSAEVLRSANIDAKVVELPHPSPQNVNRRYKSDAETPEARKMDRRDQYAAEVVQKMQE